jgi:hypothetical protein
MALQIWLPLNGNLNNQGLNTYTISNTGVIDSLGKIGSCYSYSKQYTLISGDIISNLSKFSISCWVYLTNASTYNIFTSENSSGYWQFLLGNNSIKVRDSVSGLSGSRIEKTITAIPSSVWVHVTVVYDEGVVKVYQNGVLKDTLTFHSGATMNTHDKMYIGADGLNNTSSYPGNCKINDFRVYNHCLSDKEVSEISKGLILHYKLSENYQTLNNSFKYPTFNTSSGHGGWSHWAPSNNTGTYSQNKNREYIYRDTQTYSHYFEHKSGANYYICYQSPAFEGGYRSAQAIIKMPNGEDPRGHVLFSHNANVGTNPPTTFTQLGDGFWLMKHEGFQQDGSNDLVSIYITHNKGVYISEAYLENDKKVCSDIFSTNNNVIDCSGYTREGEIIGNLTTNSDTPRYDYVTSFDGKSYIQITSPSVEVRSVSFWAKWNSIPSGQSVVFVDQKSKMGFGLMSTGILCSCNGISTNTFNKTSIVANKWYHFVIVNTGTAPTSKNRDLFINGVKQIPTSNTSDWTFDIDYLQVGKRSTTSDGFVGSISDFRMYVTPLTDNDVMDLYSTSTSVDNFGNLHCYEVDESTENLFKVEYINEVSKVDINWTLRNGEYALILNPTNFYKNGVYTKVLKGKFLSNTQYKFDLWMDSDEVIYQNVNRPGGLDVVYTDGTNSAITVTGSSSSPKKGFQHMVFYSDINKSVDYVTVYYYVGNNVYYRWDSVIIPIGNETSVNKNGIVKTGQIRENSVVASICKGDTFDTHSIIEK